MLDWLLGRGKEYSALRERPMRGIPPELAEKEGSDAFRSRVEELVRAVRESSASRPTDLPFLTVLQDVRNDGIVTMTPGSGLPQCVPFFSTPTRASDYHQALLPKVKVRFLGSSPLGFVNMLRNLEEAGIESFAIDRCPRCDVFAAVGTRSVEGPEDAVEIWARSKGQELARQELYLAHAVELARAGRLEAAREVALEMAGHVTLEDPDTHLLLGQIAVALGDRTLLAEARALLRAQGAEAWEKKLDTVALSGAPDFEAPAPSAS